ncbi:MAG: hypothetical protein WC934_07590 [Acidithiobacillus sp.]|jgi:hypothetical protein|uniref:hypothetical protein n=1 Tax=Acidithiobacillus sp. TaxID=1872118 RepID=UPI00355DBD3B
MGWANSTGKRQNHSRASIALETKVANIDRLQFIPIDIQKKIEKLALYYNDPVAFAYDITKSTFTDYQQKIMYDVADHKRVAVRSAHGTGKTFLASDIALWFLFTRSNSRVITTASLWRQVKLLWNEIGFKAARMDLPSIGLDIDSIDVNLGMIRLSPNWFATGMASDDPQKLEGQHAKDILFIVDEAKLVSHQTFSSIRGALTSEGAKLLVISTPSENNEGYFYDIWNTGMDYVKHHISAFQSPNIKAGKVIVPHLITQDWIDDCKKDWGEDSPTYITKVLGDFPDITEDTLIPYKYVEQAINRSLTPTKPIEVSCDVARFGSDSTVIMKRHGYVARIHSTVSKQDTMKTAGAIKFLYHMLNATYAKIDVIGVGSGVCDRLREQRVNVMDCNNSEKSTNPNYLNARAEGYFNLASLFKQGLIDIESNRFLIQELTSIKYKYHSSGKLMVESKEDIKKRLGRSPDYADALMYLFMQKKYGSMSSFKTTKSTHNVSNW